MEQAAAPINYRNRRKHRLSDEALETLGTIIEEYGRLAQDADHRDPGDDLVIRHIRQKLETTPESIWWSDFAIAEQCATHMLPADQVPARLAVWRRRLQDVAGRDRYNAYILTATNQAETDERKLRADLDECMNSVYYRYSSYGIAAYSRNEVTKTLLSVACAAIVFELIVLWLLRSRAAQDVLVFASWLVTASIAGILGSVVSVQRRLQDPSAASVDEIYRYITTTTDWFGTSVVSPIFGAIFGILMYGLLASKLLAGNLVNFTDKGGFPTPGQINDGAFVLVLGFVAGFAEQLIPDALTRIAKRALGGSEAETTTSAPLTPPLSQVTAGDKNGKSTPTDGKSESLTNKEGS